MVLVIILLVVIIGLIIDNWFVWQCLKDKENVALKMLDDVEIMNAFYLRKDANCKIVNWLKSNNYHRIAIAYERKAGKLILGDILRGNDTYKYCICTNAVGEIAGLDIYHPLCKLPENDLIIIISDFDIIENMIKMNNNVNTISLKELLKHI